MKRVMRKMSMNGDDQVAEYEVGVTTPARLAEIDAEFKKFQKEGWIAADVTDKKDELIQKFDPEADILLIPQMRGGIC